MLAAARCEQVTMSLAASQLQSPSLENSRASRSRTSRSRSVSRARLSSCTSVQLPNQRKMRPRPSSIGSA